MGNGASVKATNIVDTAVSVTVKKSMKTIANCTTQASSKQEINIVGDSGTGIKYVGDDLNLTIDQNMKNTLKMDCVLKSNIMSEVKNNLESDFTQTAKAEGSDIGALIGTGADATVITKIKQDILSDINMDQIMNQIARNSGLQVININGIDIRGNRAKISISQDITMETFSKAMTDVILKSIDDNVVKNTVKSSADASSSLFDFKSLIMMIIIIVIIAGVIFGAYKLYKMNQDDGDDERPSKKNSSRRSRDEDDDDSGSDDDDDRDSSSQSYGQSPPSYEQSPSQSYGQSSPANSFTSSSGKTINIY